MKYIILYTALLLLIHSAVSADTCTSLPVPDQTYECSAPGVMTASQIPDFPSSGAKQITLLFDVQVLDFCGVDRDVSLLQLQYYSASNAQAYSGFDASFSWSGSSYSVKFFSKTPAGSSTPVLTNGLGASSSVKDRWFAIFASVDLASGYAGWGFSSQAARSESTGSASFPSDAIFDSHTLLTLCPDVKCRIRNVQIFYNYYNPYPMDLALGTFATKIGRYPLTELNGNLITSDLNTMGQGHLGSDPANPDPTTTPTWSTSGLPGLTFTSKTQYVTLPYFSIAESTDTLHPILTSSMTISLWIKINTFPTSGYDYIFRYSDSSLATDRMNMKVSQSGVVVCDYRGASSSAGVALKLQEWTQVTITYGYYKSQTNNFIFSIMYWAIGKAWNYGGISTTNVNYQFGSQPTDKIMIGGFIGEMGEFSLFSPGSLIRDPPCNPTTCNLDLGFSSPGTCIWRVCPTGSYTFMSGCLTCPEGCATCTSAQTCQSCSLGYQLSSSKCNKCPAQTFATASGCVACSVSNCDICSNPTTCFKCLTGFDKYNNQCLTTCGDGNYRDPSDGTCKPCDSKCSQCTSPTVCQACNSPALLNSGTSQCECGAGTYLDAGICKTCDSKCSQCTSQTVCQACNSPFDLNSGLSQCECSKGTYLDAGTCKPCDSKCSACTDLTTCTECKPGYDLNNFSCLEPVTTIVAKNEDSTLSAGLIAVISVASVGVVSGGIYLGFLFRRRLRNKVKKVRPEPGSNSPQKALQNTEEVPVETPAVDQVQSIA